MSSKKANSPASQKPDFSLNEHDTRRYRSPVHKSFRVVTNSVLLKLSLRINLKIKVEGRQNLQNLDSNQRLIVVANHSSWLDAPLILDILPLGLARSIAIGAAADNFFQEELTVKSLVVKYSSRMLLNTFPIDRGRADDGQTFQKYRGLAAKLLADGVPIMLFPEGNRRSQNGEVRAFNSGAARLAQQLDASVVPIGLTGTLEAWPRKQPPRFRPFYRRSPIQVFVGEPLTPRDDETPEEFNQRLRKVIIQLRGGDGT